MPDWRVLPTRCEAAGCEGCRKEISSKRMIASEEFRRSFGGVSEEFRRSFGGVSEELQALLIASEELQARLVIWEELQASSIFASFVD